MPTGARPRRCSRRFGGEIEKFIGDGIVATFNSRGDQPDHALRASRAALARRSATRSTRGRARLEGLAPPGGVLIGASTRAELPDGALVEARTDLRTKGKEELVSAYELLALPG